MRDRREGGKEQGGQLGLALVSTFKDKDKSNLALPVCSFPINSRPHGKEQ